MVTDGSRWDEKYQKSELASLRIEPLLKKNLGFIENLPTGAKAVDIAAGKCHASVFLAKQGLDVTAIDCSGVGLELGMALAKEEDVSIKTLVLDLEANPLPTGSWSLICCFRYLNRALFPFIQDAIVDNGLLFFSTFNINHLEKAPRFNAEYVLQPGELQQSFQGLEILDLSDGDDPDQNLSWIVARR